MARFSERVGANVQRQALQVESMDEPLRNSLWNEVAKAVFWNYWDSVAKAIAVDVAKIPVDELSDHLDGSRQWLREYFFEQPWHGVYDIVEYLAANLHVVNGIQPSRRMNLGFSNGVNAVLERERSGYRFIDGVLAPISNPSEVESIESAIDAAHYAALPGASKHLHTALELLGKRPEPDYRNAIKEAISAVMSTACAIAETGDSGVPDAFRALDARGIKVHGAFRSACEKLYGYTSDADGIRHAILEQPNVRFDDAKFMLVVCSAFVNLLIAKSDGARKQR